MTAVRLCLASALLVLAAATSATGRVFTLGDDVPSFESNLRSAFLLRESQADFAASSSSAQERQLRLVRHFDDVLEILTENRQRSLDAALSRLERRLGQRWSTAERSAWRETLALRRGVNLRRLRQYQLRGRFPQNEHVADRAIPVFVDNYDTACAVGHLMRASGWSDAVAAIQESNNLVYVTDVKDGPLVEWVLISGLTQEEAALIQPGYEPPAFDATLDVLNQGGFVSNNGLRYDNFHYSGGVGPTPEIFLFPGFNQISLDNVGVAARDEFYVDPCCGNVLNGVYDDWMTIGGRNFSGVISVDAGQRGAVFYSYDVTAESPGALIAAASVESIPIFTFNFANGGRIDVDTRVYSLVPSGQLASLHFDSMGDGGPYVFGEAAQSFTPTKKIRVVTEVHLQGDSRYSSLVHSFHVIPEPAAAALAALGGALLLAVRLRSPRTALSVRHAVGS
jgi:hypothetical protein